MVKRIRQAENRQNVFSGCFCGLGMMVVRKQRQPENWEMVFRLPSTLSPPCILLQSFAETAPPPHDKTAWAKTAATPPSPPSRPSASTPASAGCPSSPSPPRSPSAAIALPPTKTPPSPATPTHSRPAPSPRAAPNHAQSSHRWLNTA